VWKFSGCGLLGTLCSRCGKEIQVAERLTSPCVRGDLTSSPAVLQPDCVALGHGVISLSYAGASGNASTAFLSMKMEVALCGMGRVDSHWPRC